MFRGLSLPSFCLYYMRKAGLFASCNLYKLTKVILYIFKLFRHSVHIDVACVRYADSSSHASCMVSAEKRNSPFSVKTSMWPPTYLNCWVMVDTAFLCPVLLSMLFFIPDRQYDNLDFNAGEADFLRVINGTSNTAQHKNDPPAQQKTSRRCIWGRPARPDCPTRQHNPRRRCAARRQTAPTASSSPLTPAAPTAAAGPSGSGRSASACKRQRQTPAGQKHRPVRGAAPGQFQRGIRPPAEQKQRSTFQHTKSPCTSCMATVCAGGAGCNRFVRMVGVFGGRNAFPPWGSQRSLFRQLLQQRAAGVPQLLAQVNVVAVGVLEALDLVPEGVDLRLAELLDVVQTRGSCKRACRSRKSGWTGSGPCS